MPAPGRNQDVRRPVAEADPDDTRELLNYRGAFEFVLEYLNSEALCSETNRRTLQRDLNFLLENGLLLEQGSGPTDPTRAYLPGEALA